MKKKHDQAAKKSKFIVSSVAVSLVASTIVPAGVQVVNAQDITPLTEPTITPSTYSPTTQLDVSIDYPNDATMKEYRIGTGEWQAYTGPITLTENTTIQARAKDSLGNTSTIASKTISNIDNTGPADATFSLDTTKPTQTIAVTIGYPADATIKEYRVGSGAWTPYTTPVILEENTKVEARSRDELGNLSQVSSIDITNIDRISPDEPSISKNIALLPKSVTVTVDYSEDSVIKQYKMGINSPWETYTGPVVVEENGTFYARGIDEAGNPSSASGSDITNILPPDTTPPVDPTITLSVAAPTKTKELDVTINYPEDAATKEYRIDSGEWQAYTGPITLTENKTIEARAKDASGNVSGISSLVISNIDNTAPAAPNVTVSNTVQALYDVSVYLYGVGDTKVLEYKIDDGEWQVYTAPVSLTKNATVYGRAIDEAGNVSAVSSQTISNIIDPYAQPVIKPSTTETTDSLTITIDYPIGHELKYYQIDNGGWEMYNGPFTLTKNATVSAKSSPIFSSEPNDATLVITNILEPDTVAPIEPTITPSTTVATTQLTVTVDYPTDAVVKEIKIGSGEWVAYTAPITVTENTTIQARATDEAGNVSTIATKVIDNIDVTGPAIPTINASTSAPAQIVDITIDYPADADVKEYRIGTGEWTAYTTAIKLAENVTIEARAKDTLGNVSEIASLTVTNVDRTQPALATFNLSTTAPTKTVDVTIDYAADTIVKEYRIGTGEWQAYTGAITLTNNAIIEARATDEAGNYSIASEYIVNVDNFEPGTPYIDIVEEIPLESVSVTIEYDMYDTVLAEYRLDNGEWQVYDGPFTVTKRSTLEARATDAVGNVSEIATREITEIGKEGPVISLSTTDKAKEVTVTLASNENPIEMRYSFDEWSWLTYTNPFVLIGNTTIYAKALYATGETSKISSLYINNVDNIAPLKPTFKPTLYADRAILTIEYPTDAALKEVKIGEGEWQTYTEAITTSDRVTIQARATDEAGNVSAIESYTTSWFPLKAPTVTLSTEEPTREVTVTITPTEGTVKTFYQLTGQSAYTEYTAPFVLTQNTNIRVYGEEANKVATKMMQIAISNIDNTAPTKPTVKLSTVETTDAVDVTIDYPVDAVVKEYRIGSGEWQTYTGLINLKENTTIEARATDAVGNVSEIASATVSNIVVDDIPPSQPNINLYSPSGSPKQVLIYYPADAFKREVKIGTGEWLPFTGNFDIYESATVYARAIDKAGNISTVASMNIVVEQPVEDVTPPEAPTFKPSTAELTPSMELIINYPEDTVTKLYKIDEGEWLTYTGPIEITAKGTVSARSEDASGNMSETSVIVIDNIGTPTTPAPGPTPGPTPGPAPTPPEIETVKPALPQELQDMIAKLTINATPSDKALTLSIGGETPSVNTLDSIEVKKDGIYGIVAGQSVKIADNTLNIDYSKARVVRMVNGKPRPVMSYTLGDKLVITSANLNGLVITEREAVPYIDIQATDWFKNDVENLYSYAIAQGTTATSFSPNAFISRGQFVTMIARALEKSNLQQVNYTASDLAGKWYADDAETLMNLGLVKGKSNGTFDGEGNLTREQAVLLVTRVLNYLNVDTSKSSYQPKLVDYGKLSKDGKRAVAFLTEKGILVEGDGKSFNPNNKITRAQMAKILMQALQLTDKY